MKKWHYLSVFAVCLILAGCFFFWPSAESGRGVASTSNYPDMMFVQTVDPDLGEAFEDGYPNEKHYISNVIDTFVKFIQDVHAKESQDKVHRGAHAKALACLKGHLEVENQGLAPALRVGLFAQNAKSYKAWIRISNSDQDPKKPDSMQNTRGFAIKLLGVDGEKLLDADQKPMTHDLVMVAAENFIARDNKNYPQIADGTETTLGLFFRLGPIKVFQLSQAVSKAKKEPNPLKLPFFSTTAYRLGPAEGPKTKIKFGISLCNSNDLSKFATSQDLSKNIEETLRRTDVCYELKVQEGRPQDNVEDATTGWPSADHTVAKLWIKSDENSVGFTPERQEFCENLSFSPWHALDVHRPLGRINRARHAAYMASSVFRHAANTVTPAEPTEQSFDDIH